MNTSVDFAPTRAFLTLFKTISKGKQSHFSMLLHLKQTIREHKKKYFTLHRKTGTTLLIFL